MEEETQRIAQGQVPDSVPAVLMEKDSTPSSINAIFSPPIFSPPINQFDISENSINKGFTQEDVDSVFGVNNHHDGSREGGMVATPVEDRHHFQDKMDEPMEGSEAPMMPPQDSDSDEGLAVGAEGAPITQDFNPHDAPTPTAEEVDAALAELDSIPDGVCEAGDVEEEEDEEDEWSYYRMEPQTQPQSEDVLLGGGAPSTAAVPVSAAAEDIEILPEPSDIVLDKDIVPKDHSEETDTKEPLLDHVEENQDLIDNLSSEIPSQNELDIRGDEFPSPVEETNIAPVAESESAFSSGIDGDLLKDLTESGVEKVNIEPSSPQGSGSPHVPGSPRSVEGFVTSVELNTPEESFGTNFSINQSQDPFSGIVDQTSGPFSVYVSSSPEPASLDPPAQASVDLLNMNGGMANGEEHVPNAQGSQPSEESPVEIVHAQSTVEVVAPPSPVEVSGPEMQFIADSAPVPPTDITFVPMPTTEPTAMEPVPVYVDDTPVSEPDVIQDALAVTESSFEMQKETSESYESSHVVEESFTTESVSHVEAESHVDSTVVSNIDKSQMPESPVPVMSPIEPVPITLDSSLIDPGLIPEPFSELVTSSPVENEVSNIPETAFKVTEVGPAVAETAPEVAETAPEVAETAPEVAETAPVVVETKAVAAKAETKVTKMATKAAATKTSKATSSKAGTSRITSAKTTPGKTPSSEIQSAKPSASRVAVTKTAEKKTTTARTGTTPSTSRLSSAKPTQSKPASTTPKKPVASKPSTTKTTKPTPSKPALTKTATAPSKAAGASSKTTTTAGTLKPTRPTSASRTAASLPKKPSSETKPADKTDSSKLVNGSSSRPSSQTAAARTTTATAARRSLPATTRLAAKPTAEKETKNTTNQMLSTRTTKTASSAGKTTTTTKTTAAHSTSRTTAKLNTSTSSVKSRTTASTTKTVASKTPGAATKKTLASKTTKTSATATKEASAKSKTKTTTMESGELLVNGENKIADEETSVEVIEKCAVEDIMQASAEKVLSETASSEQVIVATETTEVLANGDH